MNRIREIMDLKDSILFFDIDGVLALVEWGERNHFALTDEEWRNGYKNAQNLYTEKCVIKRMQDYLKGRDMSRIFVITKACNDNEWEDKKNFAYDFYNIPKENVFYVINNEDKVQIMKDIKKKYSDVEDYKLVMIDDTTDVLSFVSDNSDFSTAHISSFLY